MSKIKDVSKLEEWDPSIPRECLKVRHLVWSIIGIKNVHLDTDYHIGDGLVLRDEEDLRFALNTLDHATWDAERDDLLRRFQNGTLYGEQRRGYRDTCHGNGQDAVIIADRAKRHADKRKLRDELFGGRA